MVEDRELSEVNSPKISSVCIVSDLLLEHEIRQLIGMMKPVGDGRCGQCCEANGGQPKPAHRSCFIPYHSCCVVFVACQMEQAIEATAPNDGRPTSPSQAMMDSCLPGLSSPGTDLVGAAPLARVYSFPREFSTFPTQPRKRLCPVTTLLQPASESLLIRVLAQPRPPMWTSMASNI
ncbi:hypothetical protein VTI74DRAFT_8217 [Chaetomium olivicolor]